MEFSFENDKFTRFINEFQFNKTSPINLRKKALLLLLICWGPMAIYSLINGTFWTGSITNSFITHLDTQVRFLIALPIFLLAVGPVGRRLEKILRQFTEAGMMPDSHMPEFQSLIEKRIKLLNSTWPNVVIAVLCYVQVGIVLYFEQLTPEILSWQVNVVDGEPYLNFAGKWNTLFCRPLVLFLFYKWILRILVWGNLLRTLAKIPLHLYTVHPDLVGGLGFLGYSIRSFSPVAFGISALIAGKIADFMLIEGMRLVEFRVPFLAYLVLITLLIVFPLVNFSKQLTLARETAIFNQYDFINGIYRLLNPKITKKFDKVDDQDLSSEEFGSVSDLNSLIGNTLNMRSIVFSLTDILPLWVAASLPFLPVILLEIPIAELLKTVASFVL
jgi:hypothetical protein